MEKDIGRKEYLRNYYQAHKEKYRETARRWRQNNPEKVKEVNRQQYLRRKALRQEQKKEEGAGSGEQ